jgi:hypothetical protein
MGYEVYIDVRHHPRPLGEWEEQLSTAFKLAYPTGATPNEEDKRRAVVYALRTWANELDH